MLKHYIEFLSAKFDNVPGTFFVYTLDRKVFPSQTVLGQWHSSFDPQFIWIVPWLGWKAIYVETLYSEFLSAKSDNVSSNFFVYTLDQKFFPSQTVLGQWHSSLHPQFIWKRHWLGWKAKYFETLYSAFLRAKFDNVSIFLCIPSRSKILSLPDWTRAVTLLPRPSIHLNKSLTRLKSSLCWNTILSFWARNLTMYRVLFSCTPWIKNSFPSRLYLDKDTPPLTLNSFE